MGKAAGRAAAESAGRGDANVEPAVDRDAVAGQRSLEALVLEGGVGIEAADRDVGRGRQGHRGSAELPVAAGPIVGSGDPGVAGGRAGGATVEHLGVEGGGVGRKQLDSAADRVGAGGDGIELDAEPVGRDRRVGIGRGDQAGRPTEREEA